MRKLLIVGFGDIARRSLPLLRGRYRLFALARTAERAVELRRAGVTPVPGDLDLVNSLERLAGLADDLLHFAPPPSEGDRDSRTAHLLRALESHPRIPQRLVYISTTGVYGDCAGAVVAETRPVNPQSARARRRVDAERRLRAFAARRGTRLVILRVPGIYAWERLPLARLRAGTPALCADQDAFTNHIHGDDLARVVLAALHRGRPGRVYNASDGQWMRMGDYFDLVADHFGLPRPPRIPRGLAAQTLPETLLSFMRESRRIDPERMFRELRVRLRYPSVAETLAGRGA